jgi:hypothetical protein
MYTHTEGRQQKKSTHFINIIRLMMEVHIYRVDVESCNLNIKKKLCANGMMKMIFNNSKSKHPYCELFYFNFFRFFNFSLTNEVNA